MNITVLPGDSHYSMALTTSICRIIILFHFTNHLEMNWIYQRAGLKMHLTGSIETESRHEFLLVIQGMTIFLLAQPAACTWDFYNYQTPQLDYTFI